MKSPLKRLLAGLLIFGGAGVPTASASVTRAAELDVYGAELPAGQVLPVGSVSLPITPAAPAGAERASPLSPSIEAIPTPTAFHAGSALLLMLATARRLRRRRPVRAPHHS
jgi:hypothetical protein